METRFSKNGLSRQNSRQRWHPLKWRNISRLRPSSSGTFCSDWDIDIEHTLSISLLHFSITGLIFSKKCRTGSEICLHSSQFDALQIYSILDLREFFGFVVFWASRPWGRRRICPGVLLLSSILLACSIISFCLSCSCSDLINSACFITVNLSLSLSFGGCCSVTQLKIK